VGAALVHTHRFADGLECELLQRQTIAQPLLPAYATQRTQCATGGRATRNTVAQKPNQPPVVEV
jgi:hypothetical protein